MTTEPRKDLVSDRYDILQCCAALLGAGNVALYAIPIFHRFYDPPQTFSSFRAMKICSAFDCFLALARVLERMNAN